MFQLNLALSIEAMPDRSIDGKCHRNQALNLIQDDFSVQSNQ